MRKKIVSLSILLLGFNVLIWFLLLIASHAHPLLLGLGALAYSFGLRHALDADHIAAIDNTTRKLIQDGQKPITVGFFFSLGHSTIVIALSVLIILSTSFIQHNLPLFKETGSFIGALISSLFLFIVGLINLGAFIQLLTHKNHEHTQHSRGILTKIFKPFIKIVNKSWQMFFVGLLFGLGFDTATEIGLLSISATTAGQGIPFWSVILLPLAFMAGMTLIDTLDGILMLEAYRWAYIKPLRKRYYNMIITLISAIAALTIGAIQALHLIGTNTLDLTNWGYYLIVIFLALWAVSFVVYKKVIYLQNTQKTRKTG
jgi:nickel/cobalt transporter (NiCoT) family protein